MDTRSKRAIAEAAVDQLGYIIRYADAGRTYGCSEITDEEADGIIGQAREAADDIGEAHADLRGILDG